ncbi:MAG: carboxy terminal-processing peptidase [Pirellulales bacterium]|nr:carboxy terminal-processing peptidase [Pirellulales bacterium]
MMERAHLLQHELDDEISNRSITSFIDRLDPMRLYFLKSDIDGFMKKKDTIDDMVSEGDITFAYDVFKTYLDRIDERLPVINELIDADHDFTAKESINTDWDNVSFAESKDEAEDRWRKRIKYNLLVLKGDDETEERSKERLHRRYNSFSNQMHRTDSDELLEMFLNSVMASFDPHTSYMSPTTLENFEIVMRLNLDGIGAGLTMQDGDTVITKIIPGGAADKHGELKVNDRIVSVGQGEEGEMEDVIGMKLDEVVQRIRGKAGTIVRIGVIPADKSGSTVLNITRARIELTDSEAQAKVIKHTANDEEFKVGVISLPSFYMDMDAARRGVRDYKSTTRDVRKLLKGFEEAGGVDAILLDLSRNGGGSLTEAIDLTGLFIDRGPVVQVKDPTGRVTAYEDENAGVAWDGPLVVLTSKFSASASEIFAGAIADYGRGIIVGDSATHGKGTVQSLQDLGRELFRNTPNPPEFGALKITIQQFYRPNGASTQKHGVAADIILPSFSDHMDISESDLDFAVDFDKVDSANEVNLGMRKQATINTVKDLSSKRISNSEDFQSLLDRIAQYEEQKKDKLISVNEKEFFARREEVNAEKEEEAQIEETMEADDDIFPESYYNTEVLDITVDYINALGENKKLALSE